MALIRSYSQIEERRRAGELTPAEEQLLAGCRSGKPVVLGDGTRPDRASPERTIRADLLRYLILGGCEAFRTHERGIRVNGVWIDGGLDLAFATARGSTVLRDCVVSNGIDVTQAHLQRLDLEGCRLKRLWADDCHVKGDVWLARIETSGLVRLVGAKIGGQFYCNNAELGGDGGMALNAQSAQVAGGVFLEGLISQGEVSFAGAVIVGQLDCAGATLDGGDGDALNAQRLRVEGNFLWRGVASVTGEVYLASAHVSDLVDDRESWEKTDAPNLVGLTYDNLVGPLDEEMRLAWLRKGAKPEGAFHPQPYQQLAKVLRASGHRAEARAVLIEKERDQRRAARERALDGVSGFPGRALVHAGYLPHRVWSWLIGWATGYGYAPWRIIWPLLILIALQAELARNTWRAGDFAPNSDIVLVSEGWTQIANAPDGLSVNAAEIWSSETGPGRDYETFNALSYAVDVVLPLVELGQEAAWAPSPARGLLGWFAHHAQKVFVILGWIVAAIFAGAVTGVIRRDD
ncbi:hypothetical protein [Stappia sp. TSB10GB4]|uniref:hypothetical protein n=1 Tax=Stappia sp. TSB10GB4 TaxID=2003584 RepID=UPI0016465356|nr:hypothetical protein [Stappia sp. TSB10GB4]